MTGKIGFVAGCEFPIVSYNDVYNSVNDDDFYISYNDRDSAIYGCDTTALVVGQMEHFYTLNGNHVSAYKELMPKGFDACYKYFLDNAEFRNKYSE